jgi:hypothetical protein
MHTYTTTLAIHTARGYWPVRLRGGDCSCSQVQASAQPLLQALALLRDYHHFRVALSVVALSGTDGGRTTCQAIGTRAGSEEGRADNSVDSELPRSC